MNKEQLKKYLLNNAKFKTLILVQSIEVYANYGIYTGGGLERNDGQDFELSIDQGKANALDNLVNEIIKAKTFLDELSQKIEWGQE